MQEQNFLEKSFKSKIGFLLIYFIVYVFTMASSKSSIQNEIYEMDKKKVVKT